MELAGLEPPTSWVRFSLTQRTERSTTPARKIGAAAAHPAAALGVGPVVRSRLTPPAAAYSRRTQAGRPRRSERSAAYRRLCPFTAPGLIRRDHEPDRLVARVGLYRSRRLPLQSDVGRGCRDRFVKIRHRSPTRGKIPSEFSVTPFEVAVTAVCTRTIRGPCPLRYRLTVTRAGELSTR